MAQNKIVAIVLKAKNTLNKFLTKIIPPLNTLVYGPATSDIANELVEMEKKRKEILDSDPEYRTKYPNTWKEQENQYGNKKQKLLKESVNPIKNPGIIPITNLVQKINSFNLCNPLTLGVNAAFPKGSPVNEAVSKVQTELREIQLLFQNFRLIEGNRTAVGISPIPQPIQQGEFRVNIEGTTPIPNGTTVFIQQTNNNTIFTNMKGVISNSLTTKQSPVTLPTINNNTDNIVTDSNSLPTITNFTPNYTASSRKTNAFTNSDGEFSYQITALFSETTNKSYESKIFVTDSLNASRTLAQNDILFKAFADFKKQSNPNTPSANPNTSSDRSPVPSVNTITPSGVISTPTTLDTTLLVPEKPSNTTLRPISYTIQIQTFDGIDPPYKISSSGNTVFDDNDEPVLATFTNWQLEYETKQTTDIRELAEDIQGIVDTLRSINFKAISEFLDKIPPFFGNFGKLKKLVGKIADFTSDVSDIAQTAADVGSTATLALSGGLTSRQVIERSKVLSEFYEEILPILNYDLSLENVFKKQIEDVNKVLRGVVPYDQLAKLVKTIKKFVTFVTKITQFTLDLINFLNTIVKTMLVIAKVLSTVKQITEKAAIGLPTMFATAGIVNILGKVVEHIGQALDKAVPILEEVSTNLDNALRKLQFLKKWLGNLANELGRLQQTFETCDNLDLDLNDSIQGLVSLSTGIGFPPNIVREQISGLIESVANPDLFTNAQTASSLSEFGNTVITTADGTILVLPGTVWGFGPNGQIMFGGDLISGATGINFEETRGQALRKSLRNSFNFYTFNKFKGANNANLVENLQAQAVEVYANQVEKIDDLNVGDKFGNFQEVYLGYLIRIQEEKPISDTAKGESNLTRRRGVAFDSEENIVVGSDLTFSDDLDLIVNETKYKIKRNIQQGIIGVGTPSNQQFPDDDALKLAESTGANPLAVNNLKAEANNRNANSIDGGSGGQTNTDPVAMRTGNSKFEEAGGDPATIVSNQSSPNKTINTGALIAKPFADFIEENPSLKKMQDTFKLLQGASTSQLNDIMSSPGVFDLNGEELAEKLKSNIINAINPNPEKIAEIKKKTTVWLEGLKESTKIDYEQIVLNMHPKQRMAYPPFEVYYDGIEAGELDKWIRFLLSKGYTREEIESGVQEEELRDEYKIKFDQKGKGGKLLKVVISRKNQRLRDQINK